MEDSQPKFKSPPANVFLKKKKKPNNNTKKTFQINELTT